MTAAADETSGSQMTPTRHQRGSVFHSSYSPTSDLRKVAAVGAANQLHGYPATFHMTPEALELVESPSAPDLLDLQTNAHIAVRIQRLRCWVVPSTLSATWDVPSGSMRAKSNL